MTHNVIDVAVEQNTWQGLGEMVCHVLGCADPFKCDKITFNPFHKGIVFNVHVACSRGWFAGICHGGAGIVVFITKGGSFLWNEEIKEDTADVQNHASSIVCRDEFGLGG